MRLVKTGFALIALPLVALSAAAQTPAPPAAESDLEAVIAEARAWVSQPATDQRIEAFSPAADIRYREYRKPRPLRVWITRVDLTAPDVRFAVIEPLAGEPKKPKEETRSASTLDFARQRGVQLAVNASAFDPFRSHTGMPMNVVGLAAVRGREYSDTDQRFGALYITRDGLPARSIGYPASARP